MTGPADLLARLAVIDGVDVDAVAAAVRACPAVDDLCAGPWGGVVPISRDGRWPGSGSAPVTC